MVVTDDMTPAEVVAALAAPLPPEITSTGLAVALFPFEATKGAGEVGLATGSVVAVVNYEDALWWYGRVLWSCGDGDTGHRGDEGYFPREFIQWADELTETQVRDLGLRRLHQSSPSSRAGTPRSRRENGRHRSSSRSRRRSKSHTRRSRGSLRDTDRRSAREADDLADQRPPLAPATVWADRGDGTAVVWWEPPTMRDSNELEVEAYTIVALARPPQAPDDAAIPEHSAGAAHEPPLPPDDDETAPPLPDSSVEVAHRVLEAISCVTAHPDGSGRDVCRAVIDGLPNGHEVCFSVTAINAAGGSAPSLPSEPIVPGADPPGIPRDVHVEPGDTALTVSWQQPQLDGRRPITSYLVRVFIAVDPGVDVLSAIESRTLLAEAEVGAKDTQVRLQGLPNGVPLDISVSAVNTAGVGQAAGVRPAELPCILAGPPAPPRSVTAEPATGSITVNWQEPEDCGGSEIEHFIIEARMPDRGDGAGVSDADALPKDLGVALPVTVPASASGMGSYTRELPCRPTGVALLFSVRAVSRGGSSDRSYCARAVVPLQPPTEPRDVQAEPRPSGAAVTWRAPRILGDVPLQEYVVVVQPGGRAVAVPAHATRANIDGLSNGSRYAFTVAAVSEAGSSPPSAPTREVIPVSTPRRVTGVRCTGGDECVAVQWAISADDVDCDGNSLVETFIVRSTLDSVPALRVSSSVALDSGGGDDDGAHAEYKCYVRGLPNGTPQRFTVTAVNAAGEGPMSAPSEPVTPLGVPRRPTVVNCSVRAEEGEFLVTWQPPADDGGSPLLGHEICMQPGDTVVGRAGARDVRAVVSSVPRGQHCRFTVVAINALVSTNAAAADATTASLPIANTCRVAGTPANRRTRP